MEKKFGALRLIAIFYKVLGFLILCITLFFTAFLTLSLLHEVDWDSPSIISDGIMYIIAVALSLLFSLGIIGLGEVFSVFVNIEENTREPISGKQLRR